MSRFLNFQNFETGCPEKAQYVNNMRCMIPFQKTIYSYIEGLRVYYT